MFRQTGSVNLFTGTFQECTAKFRAFTEQKNLRGFVSNFLQVIYRFRRHLATLAPKVF